MPGSASDYLEEKMLKDLFQIAAYTKPAIYAALLTALPTEAGGSLAEPAGSAYARQSVPAANWSWDGTNLWVSNNTAINFPTATGSGWGTITHWALFDASSGGNMLIYAPLDAAKTVAAGDTFSFGINGIKITQD
jgi:hypothetical protein